MSINTITLSPERRPLPTPDEMSIRDLSNIEYILSLSEPGKKLDGRGHVYLSDSRVVIVADAVGADGFETLAVPLTSLAGVRADPPKLLSSSPRVTLDVAPPPARVEGRYGWCVRAELRGSKAELPGFAAALDKTYERVAAQAKAKGTGEDEFDLPLYAAAGPSGSGSGSGPSTSDVPSDAPPGYEP
ncbi:uncharacterized protein BXZ73DRAFT_102675 [Epithele typhae]|uniref:uncharacterized protein n=1 Tax=Epithele typhae TaxID=378194 RepID=UPI0020078A69|nr:uncharacterized protein BXZ73DRAFT_102675 [Epithele typhae]KAH9927079.1 hypothetical protein BXZ73DRAFT_102675 [Epithele typhae]